MKALLLICSGLLIIALADLPIGYYTFLRIAISITAALTIISEYKNGLNFQVIIFGIILTLFNPIIPVYFHDKDVWMPIDIIVAIVFGIKAFLLKPVNRSIDHNI